MRRCAEKDPFEPVVEVESEGEGKSDEPKNNRGILWEELDEMQRGFVESFTARVEAAGWEGARAWLELGKSSTWRMSPAAGAQYANGKVLIDLRLHLCDEHIAAQSGEKTGRPYLSLTVSGGPTEQVCLRIDWGERFPEVLGAIRSHQDRVDMKNLPVEVMADLYDLVPEGLAVDKGGGQLLQVTRRAPSA